MASQPRIFLVHALRESQEPSLQAFADVWPQAQVFNLLDDSLAADLAVDGAITDQMTERFMTLGRYAVNSDSASAGRKLEGILFSCSAFGPAIEQVRRSLQIPVLRPNEAAFEEALDAGSRIGLMVTFPKALPPLVGELEAMAKKRGQRIELVTTVADGALAALKAGDANEHDRIVAAAAAAMPAVDALVLCQFSLARAAKRIAQVDGRRVLTTPASAVAKMRRLVEAAASNDGPGRAAR